VILPEEDGVGAGRGRARADVGFEFAAFLDLARIGGAVDCLDRRSDAGVLELGGDELSGGTELGRVDRYRERKIEPVLQSGFLQQLPRALDIAPV
jgi:hypothetical protein